MSLIQFEDMYDICCELMNVEERESNVKPPTKRFEIRRVIIPDNRWWEDAIQEIVTKRERELFTV